MWLEKPDGKDNVDVSNFVFSCGENGGWGGQRSVGSEKEQRSVGGERAFTVVGYLLQYERILFSVGEKG